MPITICNASSKVASGRTTPACWARSKQRLARLVDRRAAVGEERGVARHVREQLVGQRVLGREVADEAVQPAVERLPRRELGEVRGRPAQAVDLVEVDGLEQVLARGKLR